MYFISGFLKGAQITRFFLHFISIVSMRCSAFGYTVLFRFCNVL